MNNRFIKKTAIITGAAMGIGKAVARRLGEEGATLALLDINEQELNNTIDEFKKIGIGAKCYVTNVSSESDVKQTFSAIEKEWKQVDILVHAAGIVGPSSTKITHYSAEDFDTVSSVNLKGTFLVAKYT